MIIRIGFRSILYNTQVELNWDYNYCQLFRPLYGFFVCLGVILQKGLHARLGEGTESFQRDLLLAHPISPKN